jgi:hypothetical protein
MGLDTVVWYNPEVSIPDLAKQTVDKGLLEKGGFDELTNVYRVTQRMQREIEARCEGETSILTRWNR